VVGGTVFARAITNGHEQTVSTTFEVRRRDRSWGPDRWILTEEAGPIRPNEIPSFEGGNLGWNCAAIYCGSSWDPWISPDLRQTPNAGYTVGQVSSGPNTGLWYVGATVFRMDRLSNIIPQARADADDRVSLTGETAQLCREVGPFGSGPTHVNFYEFNQLCGGLDMGAFLRATLDHEGRGSGAGNGHQAQAEHAAALVDNDPHAQLEAIVADTEQRLRTLIAVQFTEIDQNIRIAAAPEPTGNWTAGYWLWHWVDHQFHFTPHRPLTLRTDHVFQDSAAAQLHRGTRIHHLLWDASACAAPSRACDHQP
jgi:hypothetical protein